MNETQNLEQNLKRWVASAGLRELLQMLGVLRRELWARGQRPAASYIREAESLLGHAFERL